MVFVNVKVNEKGQIVIPKVLRDAYGIEPKSEIMIGEKNDELVIERKMTDKEFMAALRTLPKRKMQINSEKDYAEEMKNR